MGSMSYRSPKSGIPHSRVRWIGFNSGFKDMNDRMQKTGSVPTLGAHERRVEVTDPGVPTRLLLLEP